MQTSGNKDWGEKSIMTSPMKRQNALNKAEELN